MLALLGAGGGGLTAFFMNHQKWQNALLWPCKQNKPHLQALLLLRIPPPFWIRLKCYFKAASFACVWQTLSRHTPKWKDLQILHTKQPIHGLHKLKISWVLKVQISMELFGTPFAELCCTSQLGPALSSWTPALVVIETQSREIAPLCDVVSGQCCCLEHEADANSYEAPLFLLLYELVPAQRMCTT